MRIIIGLLIMVAGLILLIKTEWFLRVFGRISFFDRYLGTSGGSRLGYKLVGIVAVFIGILVATDLINNFILWLFGPVISLGK